VRQLIGGSSVSIFRLEVSQVERVASYVGEELENRPWRAGMSNQSQGLYLGSRTDQWKSQVQERMMEEKEALEREMTKVHLRISRSGGTGGGKSRSY
jgi:hypothetical protein